MRKIFFIFGVSAVRGRRVSSQYDSAMLTASDGAYGDYFSSAIHAVASTENLIVGGANGDDDYGSAYIFQRLGNWTEMQKLTASDAGYGANFGCSVAIEGNVIVVGAPGDDNAGGYPSASAYVFQSLDDGTTWTEEQKLMASDAASYDEFGFCVAVAGNLIVVGSFYDDEFGLSSGSAYVFRRFDDGWAQVQKLTASDAEYSDEFGYSVAVAGNIIVVGARREDGAFVSAGAAYVFQSLDDDGNFTEVQKLTASDAASLDYFGSSVDIDGNLIVVGADENDDAGSNSGSAYVFRGLDDGTTWNQRED